MMQKNKGYYQVDGILFRNKVKAILEAQKRDLPVTYHFNDEWWDTADWTKEPSESLHDIYIKRAHQLRDSYETLVLRYSGGADSYNILRTFIDNGIKLDYVVTNVMQDMIYQDFETHPGNIERLTISIPTLQKLKEQGADFKLVISDISRFLLTIDNPDWIFRIDHAPRFTIAEIINPQAMKHEIYNHIDKPTTGVIMGIDKATIWPIRHPKIYTFQVPDYLPCHLGFCNNMAYEPFYFTADMPALPIKQSHVVKNYLKDHPEVSLPALNSLDFKRVLVPLLYPKYYHFSPGDPLPYWDSHFLQCERMGQYPHQPRGTNDGVEIHKTPVYKAWCDGIDLADKLIDRKFKHEDSIWTNGLVTMFGKNRWVGK
jgi:hypothetical protein